MMTTRSLAEKKAVILTACVVRRSQAGQRRRRWGAEVSLRPVLFDRAVLQLEAKGSVQAEKEEWGGRAPSEVEAINQQQQLVLGLQQHLDLRLPWVLLRQVLRVHQQLLRWLHLLALLRAGQLHPRPHLRPQHLFLQLL